jgi:hypothetical protein
MESFCDAKNLDMDKLRVSCYAGYRGEETPQLFSLGRKKITVCKVIDRWMAPEHRYFKLLGSDNGIYILRHDAEADCWQLTLYNRDGSTGPE